MTKAELKNLVASLSTAGIKILDDEGETVETLKKMIVTAEILDPVLEQLAELEPEGPWARERARGQQLVASSKSFLGL
jgi:hypothetical protein